MTPYSLSRLKAGVLDSWASSTPELRGKKYSITSRANYSFNPIARSFSQVGQTTEASFGATLATSGLRSGARVVSRLEIPEQLCAQVVPAPKPILDRFWVMRSVPFAVRRLVFEIVRKTLRPVRQR